jgi:hypothetical protein
MDDMREAYLALPAELASQVFLPALGGTAASKTVTSVRMDDITDLDRLEALSVRMRGTVSALLRAKSPESPLDGSICQIARLLSGVPTGPAAAAAVDR